MESGISSWLNLVGVAIVIAPAVLVLMSKRVQGSEKLLFAVIILFTSWLGYLLFVLLKPRRIDSGRAA